MTEVSLLNLLHQRKRAFSKDEFPDLAAGHEMLKSLIRRGLFSGKLIIHKSSHPIGLDLINVVGELTESGKRQRDSLIETSETAF
jgi:hypothetical protein